MAVANSGSKVDYIYRAAIQAPKFFSKGWGDIRLLERLFQLHSSVITSDSRPCPVTNRCKTVSDHYVTCKQAEINIINSNSNGLADIFECEFKSPLVKILPGALPKESETARFQLVLPKDWNKSKKPSNRPKRKAMCIHLAGTGDHFYWRRRHFMATPLIKERNIGSIILENPFYGGRKPKPQTKSGLRHVSDLFVMGAALFFEIITLLSWCESQGYGPLGVTGISMGGHMASIASTGWNKPIGIIPCLSWSTAAPVFTEGVMKLSVSWKALEEQLISKPEYITLLERYCQEFAEQKKEKMTNFAMAGNLNETTAIYDAKDILQPNFSSQQDSQNESNMENRYKNYDVDKKKLGPFAIDFDSVINLNNLQTNIMNTFSGKLNFDGLRQYSFPSEGLLKNVSQDTIDYMNGILNEFTHLRKYNSPVPGCQIINVFANYDKYVPRGNVESLAELWPQVNIRYIDCGHIIGVLKYQKVFRDAIFDALSGL